MGYVCAEDQFARVLETVVSSKLQMACMTLICPCCTGLQFQQCFSEDESRAEPSPFSQRL